MYLISVKLISVLLWTVYLATAFGTASTGAYSDSSDRVLLREVSVLTLYDNRMTSGRRSSPVPQLTCAGGTARGYFTPKVVQCHNRGSDGHEIQWECKTEMDDSFQFGSVEVTCEGYDYPDDPYILKGSCGLEYTVDLTAKGYDRYKQQKSHSYESHHSQNTHGYNSNQNYWGKSKSAMGDLLFVGGIALVAYVIYKSCLSTNTARDDAQPHARRMGDNQPPPYGFRSDYMPGSDSYGGCSSGNGTYYNTNAGTNAGGGFWSGAATGGLLGYLFGRNTGYDSYTMPGYQSPYYNRHANRGWFSGWGSGGGSSSGYYSGSGGTGGFSTGASSTRTASGFGGTKRR